MNPAPEYPVYIRRDLVTTAFTIDNCRIRQNLGIVRGIVVRSRSLFGTLGAGLQTLVGGDITLLSELCEKTREDAFERMLVHAAEVGANAVIGVRYDTTEVMQGVTEVLCYGTAVVVERAYVPTGSARRRPSLGLSSTLYAARRRARHFQFIACRR